MQTANQTDEQNQTSEQKQSDNTATLYKSPRLRTFAQIIEPNESVTFTNNHKKLQTWTNTHNERYTVFCAASKHHYQRLLLIPTDLLNIIFRDFFSHNEDIERIITDKLSHWRDPIASTTSNHKFNFLQYCDSSELPAFSHNPRRIKFRTKAYGGPRVHWVTISNDQQEIYYCAGLTDHDGKYRHRIALPDERTITIAPRM